MVGSGGQPSILDPPPHAGGSAKKASKASKLKRKQRDVQQGRQDAAVQPPSALPSPQHAPQEARAAGGEAAPQQAPPASRAPGQPLQAASKPHADVPATPPESVFVQQQRQREQPTDLGGEPWITVGEAPRQPPLTTAASQASSTSEAPGSASPTPPRTVSPARIHHHRPGQGHQPAQQQTAPQLQQVPPASVDMTSKPQATGRKAGGVFQHAAGKAVAGGPTRQPAKAAQSQATGSSINSSR